MQSNTFLELFDLWVADVALNNWVDSGKQFSLNSE